MSREYHVARISCRSLVSALRVKQSQGKLTESKPRRPGNKHSRPYLPPSRRATLDAQSAQNPPTTSTPHLPRPDPSSPFTPKSARISSRQRDKKHAASGCLRAQLPTRTTTTSTPDPEEQEQGRDDAFDTAR
uniref:Uncharacterized protein n=1 Tax=Mycena chlorophos TaxID=658473 RepID=A0ABQ0L938_MYCCL|nr:predicted protein [Mycena chlorophos]